MTYTKKRFIAGLLLAGLAVTVTITACNAPYGFGETIDWEPPVLTLDPPYLRYVRLGSKLTGTVTDNVAVDRVILREASSGEEMALAVLLDNDRWEITLEFTEEDNNRKIAAEVVAYDKVGNSGESSIAAVTLIVDLRPPVIEDIWIQRSPSKETSLEPLYYLQNLEIIDPLGENSEYLNKYQNGWFIIQGQAKEAETRIVDIVLEIYDIRDYEHYVYSRSLDSGTPLSSPRWTVREEDILAGGKSLWPDYETNYYDNGERYYYYVVIKAYDRSDNEGNNRPEAEMVEQQLFFCMWETADEPKGILDPVVVGAGETTVPRKFPLPILFFDDDTMEWAFAEMMRAEEWDKIDGANDTEKLQWLENHVSAGTITGITNWRGEPPKERLGGPTDGDTIAYEYTGSGDDDYGKYVLFTLVKDMKKAPHPIPPPVNAKDTIQGRVKGRAYKISVVDDNQPLIVFDTVDVFALDYDVEKHTGGSTLEPITEAQTSNSPEENTFPRLAADGQSFAIEGYTLREASNPQNEVKQFRMAWIPQGLINDPTTGMTENEIIKQVEDALKYAGTVDYLAHPFPDEVQHWNFDLILGTPQLIGTENVEYKKQVFKKTFNIFGDADDDTSKSNVHTTTASPEGTRPPMDPTDTTKRNFHYKGALENDIKTFVFCAIDNMEHDVYRTVRLLGNKQPPTLTVYDITQKPELNNPDDVDLLIDPPDLYSFADSQGEIGDDERKGYEDELDVYQEDAYDIISQALNTDAITISNDDKTQPFQTYTRGTVLKYWVTAEEEGDIAIETITVDDITIGDRIRKNVGHYDPVDRTLSFTEKLPEVTQRVFLFTAVDKLGNEAQIQRTAAVTSTAFMTHISTVRQDGVYGISEDTGQTITLRAFFSGAVAIDSTQSGGEKPLLNVGYRNTDDDYVIEQLVCTTDYDTPQLYLEFEFEVKEHYAGQLITLYEGTPHYTQDGDTPTFVTPGITAYDRPLTLNGAVIVDANRGTTPAFTPGNTAGFSSMAPWTTAANSLQAEKAITLDGVRPILSALTLTPKPGTPDSTTIHYFKSGETISFTLHSTNSDIRPGGGGNPRIQFSIQPSGGATQGPYYANYVRPSGGTGMVFSHTVNTTTPIPVDGQIANFSLNTTNGTIVNDVGNKPVTYTPTLADTVIIDQTPPPVPAFELSPVSTNIQGGVSYYQGQPELTIPAPSTTAEPWGVITEYSLNGGLTWTVYSDPVQPPTGESTLQTRYTDMAGNVGPASSQKIHVNAAFPRLLSITAAQPDGFYKAGDSITFNLAFDDVVYTQTAANVTITLFDWSKTSGDGNDSGAITLVATAIPQTTPNSTVSFVWNINDTLPANPKELRNGMFVRAVNFAGLSDRFGNTGISETVGDTGATAPPFTAAGVGAAPNLSGQGLKVDCIAPRVDTYSPGNGGIATTRTQVILTFNEPVMKGSGTITIKPSSTYLIPPVFENEGYYLDTDAADYHAAEARSADSKPGWTWVAGFSDIYNSLGTADKNALTESTNATPNMSDLRLNDRTGQSYGPYMKITHGLKDGAGYTGNYSAYSGNGPNPEGGTNVANTYLIPDTATKWVLDYQYGINDNNATVNAIRTALSNAKFRWQELDVVSAASINADGTQVTITLNEPLQKGLEWVLYYSAGTFTDIAGNNAPAIADGNYSFWSDGVQAPVIRVNRRSYDARNANWSNFSRVYQDPPAANWTAATTVTSDIGWSIADFNTIHYRIETETRGAVIDYSTAAGSTTDTNRGSITAAWTGSVGSANWSDTAATNGTWVLPNLIRRSGAGNYTVTENGFNVTRTMSGNNYQGFRSYNRDILKNTLLGITLAGGQANGFQNAFTYTDLEARKDYVVAQAKRTGHENSQKGYEGVFRTVLALNQASFGGGVGGANQTNNPFMVQGSNEKNGMPSIAGFPVRDAEESGDNRFIKLFYRAAYTANTSGQFYWVSTEIVCEWFELTCGRRVNDNNATGGTHMSDGEVNNYLTVSYGDLTYSYNQR